MKARGHKLSSSPESEAVLLVCEEAEAWKVYTLPVKRYAAPPTLSFSPSSVCDVISVPNPPVATFMKTCNREQEICATHPF